MNYYNNDNFEKQTHTHEYLGSDNVVGSGEYAHNHRFAGVSNQAIFLPDGNHYHQLKTNTDYSFDHFHTVVDETSPAIALANGRHVHFVEGRTAKEDGHDHEYSFSTLI